MNLAACTAANLADQCLLVAEENPDQGPVERTGEQGLQADIDDALIGPLQELAETSVEAIVAGKSQLVAFTPDIWAPLKAKSPV